MIGIDNANTPPLKISSLKRGMHHIYLDYNATTPVLADVVEAMLPFFNSDFGNPSSGHNFGTKAAIEINKSRSNIGKLINSQPENIYFTSGGTESNNLAIKGYLRKFDGEHIQVITSSIEHSAVKEVLKSLKSKNVEVTSLPVDQFGRINIEQLKSSIKSTTKLISIMAVNNITGIIQDLEEIGSVAKLNKIPFHTDGVQALGKMPLDVERMNIDMMSMSSHKLYGPKGIGALYIRNGIDITTLIEGGGQERGIRSGTENVPGIVGFGKSCEIARLDFDKFIKHTTQLRDIFIREIRNTFNNFVIITPPEFSVPTTVNVSFPEIRAQSVVDMMNYYGIALSTCSACSSNNKSMEDICPPLMALGLEMPVVQGAIRFSFGKFTTLLDIINTIGTLNIVVNQLKKINGN